MIILLKQPDVKVRYQNVEKLFKEISLKNRRIEKSHLCKFFNKNEISRQKLLHDIEETREILFYLIASRRVWRTVS